jgi:hypothetical protein
VILSVRAGGWPPLKQFRCSTPPLMPCDWPRLLQEAGAVPSQAVVDATHIAICNCSRDGLPPDVELRPQCERYDENTYRNDLPKRGLRTAGFMHTRRTLED